MRSVWKFALLTALAAFLTHALPASAQVNEFDLEIPADSGREAYVPGPQFVLGVGLAPAPTLIELFTDVTVVAASLGSVEVETESDDLAWFAQYVHPVTERASFIAHFGTTRFEKTYTSDSDSDFLGTVTNRYYSLLIGAKSYYARTATFSLYGDVLLGATLLHASSDTPDLASDDKTLLGFQITPLGLRVGNEVAVDVSAGFGYAGMLMVSVDYSF